MTGGQEDTLHYVAYLDCNPNTNNEMNKHFPSEQNRDCRVMLLLLLSLTVVAGSSSWSEWSCVRGSWMRSLTTSQVGGRCSGEDVPRCLVSSCRPADLKYTANYFSKCSLRI